MYLSCRISIFYVQTLSGLYQGKEKWLLNKKAGALIRRGSANSVLQLLVTFFCPVGIQKLIVNLRVDAKVQLQVLVRRLRYKIMRFLIREPNFVSCYSAKLNFLIPACFKRMKFSDTRPPRSTCLGLFWDLINVSVQNTCKNALIWSQFVIFFSSSLC